MGKRFLAFIVVSAMFMASEPVQSAPLAGKAPDLDKVAGVYKHHFKNGLVGGDTYQSEDVFELVNTAPNQAYFRIETQFFNGHSCSLYGLALLEPTALVYHGSKDYEDKPCELRFTTNAKGIIENDVGGHCRAQFCGARGAFGEGADVTYPFAWKRPIRYMKRLLASAQYNEAVAEHANAKSGMGQ